MIRLDRLEACFQANSVRDNLNMGDWGRCLTGGYNRELAKRCESGNDPLQLLAEHFGIDRIDALDLFGMWGLWADNSQDFFLPGVIHTPPPPERYRPMRKPKEALATLRKFIDTRSVNSMDFKDVAKLNISAGCHCGSCRSG